MSQLSRETINVASERAVLVGVHLPGVVVDPEDPFAELRSLVETAGARVVGELIQRRRKPDGKWYLGKGKVDELAALVKLTNATLVVFDNDLAPHQIGSVEESTGCKVIDRSELILDIFANRAATHAAKLQVELAQLEYTYPRLRAMWDHLGQIVGGAPIGVGTRGPGETQIEMDRRVVKQRKAQLRRELDDILQRKHREVESRNLDHYTVGLVGYTNAGKSTLFNRLTSGGAYADNRLFSTLATRVEKWNLGGGNAVMLSDTVGFIRNLPHHLVASFRSTLEETRYARLILIVLDVSDPHVDEHLQTVQKTLDDIGASDQPRLLVLNKIDLVEQPCVIDRFFKAHPDAIQMSAINGDGTDGLRQATLNHMLGGVREVLIELPFDSSKALDFIENRAVVLDRTYTDSSVQLRVRIGRLHVDQLLAQGPRMTINGLEPLQAAQEIWGSASCTPIEQPVD